jgi:ubiquinone/menaquinone biosynthesis C-methylase UbiE
MTEPTTQHGDHAHNQVVREEFTRQAITYAAHPAIANPFRLARLVQTVRPNKEQRVLEVATGPGYVAMAFAALAREVVGIDLTEAPLALAEERRQEQGIHNVRFQLADAAQLPFADGEFDIVVCRLALHHFANAKQVVREMVRVCARSGVVAVEDIIVSEHVARAAYHNRFENLRDPSHATAFSLSTLLRFLTDASLEIEHVSTDHVEQVLERWLANTQTPPERAMEVRQMIERDARENLSGTRPFRGTDAQWCFLHHMAVVVGRKLAGST